ncbi:hypothetical protein EDD16DRAFT_764512 [Pisolithus croceorrhizus]|nr:hypothetical protein EDD16DRAFT_764512 [Pisolithus croceorrhizus]
MDSPHSFSQPGLVLPTQSMQNHIHELVKTSLPPPRKQNIACDACRARKVKCCKLPGQDKCQVSRFHSPSPSSHLCPLHVISIACRRIIPARSYFRFFSPTLYRASVYPRHYVQQATSEKKRNGAARRPRGISSSSSHSPVENGVFPWSKSTWSIPWGPRISSHASHLFQTSTPNLLYHLFAPPDYGTLSRSSAYAAWGDVAIKLEDETYRAEFAVDLVEVYFQIVHTRLPLLDPSQFRSRLNFHTGSPRLLLGSKQEDPLHPALIATVLAWGAKFSEHPLLVADRNQNKGQSLLAKALVDRCRELAESTKVHRIPHEDHVVIALLIEPLQCQDPTVEPGYHGFWLGCAIRNLLGLGINHKSNMIEIKDQDTRGRMIFAWWMACLCDAFSSFYYHRKPILDDDDYDIDFYTATRDGPDSANASSREQLEFLGYYAAAHELARISRKMARQLWQPQTDCYGLPFEAVEQYMSDLVEWRDKHLSRVGVPASLVSGWDFITAVSACASDAQYHVMWIFLFNALEEHGIQEQEPVSPGERSRHESMKQKIFEEALQASLRVSALAGVLSANGYLKLDTAVMHVSIIRAGVFLARLGRPEVQNCIEGLRQYTYAYEETGDQAEQIERTYKQTAVDGPNFQRMASVIPRTSPHHHAHSDLKTNGHDHPGSGTR